MVAQWKLSFVYILHQYHLVVDVIITCTLYMRKPVINETDALIQFYSERDPLICRSLDLSLSELFSL